jgi:hypothetical protein
MRRSAFGRAAAVTARAVAAGTVAALLATGCTADPAPPPPPPPLELAWQEVSLPAAPAGLRTLLRAAAICDGRWYLVGGYLDPTLGDSPDATAPAAWTSTDGRTWTPMAFAFSGRNYWATVAVLYSAACRGEHLVTIGAKPGGAHGNPRVMTFHPVPAPDGTDVLTEQVAYFETYGGPTANNVSLLRSGPDGLLITGNRTSGAAVWNSTDGVEFELLEGAPVLAVAPGEQTWAYDAVAVDGGWVVVGGALPDGRIDRDAAAWQSADGRTWQRMAVPHDDTAYDELGLVIADGATLVAVGRTGDHFQAWRRTAGGWRYGGTFGSAVLDAVTPGGPLSVPYPADLAGVGGLLVTAVASRGTHELYGSTDGGLTWRFVPLPRPGPAGAGRDVVLAGVPARDGAPDRLLMAIDDGTDARLFLADLAAR